MTTPYEHSLQQTLDEADAIASRSGLPSCSGHLLLALLGPDSAAKRVLADRGLQPEAVSAQLEQLAQEDEPTETLARIRERCIELARGSGSPQASGLHLLISLAAMKHCAAYRVLTAAGVDVASLRSVALALATSGAGEVAAAVAPAASTPAEGTDEAWDADSRAQETVGRPSGRISPRDGSPRATMASVSGELSARARRRLLVLDDPRVTRHRPRRSVPAAERAKPRAVRFVLDEGEFPTLAALGRDLSADAERGQIERLVGRKREVQQILDILGKRRANNPCLVGEPGVGKTAIVEGLAYLQANEPDGVPFLADRCLIGLNMGALLSGTQLRGAFAERVAALRGEMERADGKVIVFLDDVHTLVGAGGVGDGSVDAVSELSAAMAQGTFPCIGATTPDRFRQFLQRAPALQRRLQPIVVPEPTPADTLAILRGIGPAYAEHHQIEYLQQAYEAAARLSQRYIADRFLPDKAIHLLDLAGSRARRIGGTQVGRAEIAELVAEIAEIPLGRLLMTDADRFLQMDGFLQQRIVGHAQIIDRVAQVVRRNYAGFASQRPIGSFLFLGPTGVGKTEIVKVLADFLFQSRDAMYRLDMSEFMEAHSVARLIGSPPGYVGYEQGGQLTESVRSRPYQIVLLDEVEKAHRDVLQILLQLLDEGRLTDGRGRTVDFSNTVVVMTSNLGSAHYDRRRSAIGFGVADDAGAGDEWQRVSEQVLSTARGCFPVELWNRIEERLVFQPLTQSQVRAVARILIRASSDRLAIDRDIRFDATDAAVDYLIENGGFDPLLGARPMRTAIQRLIESPVAELILAGHASEGDLLRVDCVDGQLTVGTVRDPLR